MATFKAVIKRGNKRAHESKVRFIPTTMYVTKKDITASFKIKNADILDRCNDLIKVYRERVNELNLEFNDIDIDTVVAYLRQKRDKKGISFTDFARAWMKQHVEIKGMKNYKTSLNAFCAFVGRNNILCGEKTMFLTSVNVFRRWRVSTVQSISD